MTQQQLEAEARQLFREILQASLPDTTTIAADFDIAENYRVAYIEHFTSHLEGVRSETAWNEQAEVQIEGGTTKYVAETLFGIGTPQDTYEDAVNDANNAYDWADMATNSGYYDRNFVIKEVQIPSCNDHTNLLL